METTLVAEVADAAGASLAAFDEVIDVRSPAEFAEDHVPGAVNLPVLADEERSRVGVVYVQDDPFRARRLGAALVARNIAAHLETALAGRGGGWRPLLYCWRGGQRSRAMAAVLSQVGWRVGVLRGGYRTYRREVVRDLYDGAPPARVVLLGGGTGVGKTEVLERLAAHGVQTLDLEGLAQHRGSLFGGLPGASQPSQKLFESRLHAALAAVDPARPLVVEAESSRIGERFLPPRLWAAMVAAPTVELTAPLEARSRRLTAAYAGGGMDPQAVAAALDRLPRHIGRERVAAWRELLSQGETDRLARELMQEHYDPAYARGRLRGGAAAKAAVSTGAGVEEDLARAAAEVAALLA